MAELEPSPQFKTRVAGIINGILKAWDKADVVCLGEDHAGKNDSDLRIALVENPEFTRRVRVVMVEFANVKYQDMLDRFALDGEDIPREKLRVVWQGIGATTVWNSPVYEAFLRAVRRVNLALPREKRIRLVAGDSEQPNRGKYIREAIARELLDKKLKSLAVYGAGHCECRGGGFPGEIGDKYPGKIFAVFNFYDTEEGRRTFKLGDEPQLIQISGTEKEKMPVGRMFFLGRANDPSLLGDIANAIIHFGNIKDSKVAIEP